MLCTVGIEGWHFLGKQESELGILSMFKAGMLKEGFSGVFS